MRTSRTPSFGSLLAIAAAAACQAFAELPTDPGLVLLLADLGLTLLVIGYHSQADASLGASPASTTFMLVAGACFFAAVVTMLLLPRLRRSGLFANVLAVASYLAKVAVLVVIFGQRLVAPPSGLLTPAPRRSTRDAEAEGDKEEVKEGDSSDEGSAKDDVR